MDPEREVVLVVNHIEPSDLSGEHGFSNLRAMCSGCHTGVRDLAAEVRMSKKVLYT